LFVCIGLYKDAWFCVKVEAFLQVNAIVRFACGKGWDGVDPSAMTTEWFVMGRCVRCGVLTTVEGAASACQARLCCMCMRDAGRPQGLILEDAGSEVWLGILER
jgi:hypothetical protein